MANKNQNQIAAPTNCNLCNKPPQLFRDEDDGFEGASCNTHECPLYNVEMSREEWAKLNKK